MKSKTLRLRLLVMFAVLALCAVGFFTAFGIGNSCALGFADIVLACPLGALLSMIAQRAAVPMAVVSIVAALVICMVLGRVFCSWVCPVHFMTHRGGGSKKKASAAQKASEPLAKTDGAAQQASGANTAALTEAERKTLRAGCAGCASPCGKSKGIKLDSRHGILAAALVSTGIFGFPVFCIICPVGLTFASVLLIMRLFAFGETTWTIIAFIAIILAEVLLLPKWCHKFCPLGALLSLFSGLNKTLRPQVDATKCLREAGHNCTRCTDACPEGINLHDIASGATTLNDCSKCRLCADVCPEGAISFPVTAGAVCPGSMVINRGMPEAPAAAVASASEKE